MGGLRLSCAPRESSQGQSSFLNEEGWGSLDFIMEFYHLGWKRPRDHRVQLMPHVPLEGSADSSGFLG